MPINVNFNPDGVNVNVDGAFSPWEEATATNIQAEYGKAYILNGGSFQTVLLPQAASGSKGKSFAVTGVSSELYKVEQNASQVINGISWSTTPGSPNGLTAKHVNCSAIFVCTDDNGLFFKVTYLAGYFTADFTFPLTVNNDGQVPQLDGTLMIGSSSLGEPTPGNIISSDNSITVTNQAGQIDITTSSTSQRSYGQVKMQDNGGTGHSIAYATWPTKIEFAPIGAAYFTSLSDFVNNSDMRLQYTGTQTKTFAFNFYLSTETGAVTTISLSVNGVEDTDSLFTYGNSSNGDANVQSGIFYKSLNQNDEVFILTSRNSSPQNIACTHAVFSIFEI